MYGYIYNQMRCSNVALVRLVSLSVVEQAVQEHMLLFPKKGSLQSREREAYPISAAPLI